MDFSLQQIELSAQIAHYQALLEKTRQQLVDAETGLAERLAQIEQFEFRLRANLSPQMNRLERLQKEIEQLRRELRQAVDQWGDIDREHDLWSIPEMETIFQAEGATAAGHFRYRPHPTPPPDLELAREVQAELKQLYRQLARRFHPDMAVDELDGTRRTDLMTAVNAAYAAGDLEQLRQIALEPESANLLDSAQSEAELLAALQEELARCRRRLEEIEAELARLNRRKSARLLARVEKAEADGRDWLQEIMQQMKEEIAHKMVERDILKSELEVAHALADEELVGGSAFADAVWQMSLDQAVDGEDALEIESWLRRRQDRTIWYDDNEDDVESWS